MFHRFYARLAQTGAMLTAMLAIPFSVQAVPLYAAVQNGQLGLFGSNGNPQFITQASQWRDIRNVTFSRDGRYIAFIGVEGSTAAEKTNLGLHDRTSNQTRTVATGLAPRYPISFSSDSATLVYATPGKNETIDVRVQNVTNVDGTRVITLPSGSKCSEGSRLPTEQQYSRETEGLGGASLVLELTTMGLIYSPDCSGNSVALIRVTEPKPVIVYMVDQISRVVVSHSGTKVAGIRLRKEVIAPVAISIFDFSTGKTSDLEIDAHADRVVWSLDDASLFYSVQAFDTVAKLDPRQEPLVKPLLGKSTYVRWSASLHRIDLTTQKITDLFREDAFAIGRILPTENDDVYVTLIPNLDAWVNAIADRSYTPAEDKTGEKGLALVPVSLWKVSLTGQAPNQIAEGVNHTTLNP